MKMVESIIDIIYENRVTDLDRLINEKGVIELHKKAVNADDLEDKDNIIFQLIVMTMELAYKTGFRDGLRLLLEMINIER